MGTRRDDVWKTMELKEPEQVPITELSIDPPHVETLMFPERYWSPQDRPASERIELLKRNADVLVRCYDRLGFSLVRASVALTPPLGWSAKVISEEAAISFLPKMSYILKDSWIVRKS